MVIEVKIQDSFTTSAVVYLPEENTQKLLNSFQILEKAKNNIL